MSRYSLVLCWLAVALCVTAALSFGAAADLASLKAGKADLKSAGALAFGPDGILFVGDSMNASIVAIDTNDRTPAKPGGKIEIRAINQKIAAMLGTTPDQILVNDAVVNPISQNVYLSVHRGKGPDAVPVILRADSTGQITEVSLANVKHSTASLPNAVPADLKDRRGTPLRVDAITDIAYVNGNVYVAGLSNEEFASAFRMIPFPFQQAGPGAGIEIYHGSHGRFETNAPIRTFVPYNVGNQPSILAAYTCTPLVRIPTAELKPGSKVKGVTIAELGSGNRPLDMIVYNKGGRDYLLMANSSNGVQKLAIVGFDKAQPINSPISGTSGVPFELIPDLKGVQQLDKYDDNNALLLTDAGGTLDLRTIPLP